MRKSLVVSCAVAVAGGVVAGRSLSPRRGRDAAPSRPAVTAVTATPKRPAVEFVSDRDESAAGVRFAARGHGSGAVVSATDVVLRVNAAAENGD
jgi:hypothetical protein